VSQPKSICFSEVLTYTEGVREDLRKLIIHLDPQSIALNYSEDNPVADGLTYGMFQLLKKHLAGTPYVDRFLSAETLLSKLRSRKLPAEIDLISDAARLTVQAWERAVPQIKTGMSEKEVAAVIEKTITEMGGEIAFETIVNACDKTIPGHGSPTDIKLEPGDLLHVDFGARIGGYCADLQRLLYFRRPGEDKAPETLIEAFATVRHIIDKTGEMCCPGIVGMDIDKRAREILADYGYPEYQHALGHQLGRAVHDGGALIGPNWKRYGKSTHIPLELNNVFTLELEINLPGIGCVGLEEDICVTENGARFLCPRQQELIVR